MDEWMGGWMGIGWREVRVGRNGGRQTRKSEEENEIF